MVSCMEKWSREQSDATVRQPSPPPGIEQALSGTLKGRQLIEFNRESVALWKALVLKPCSACSRTFFPGQLAKHQAACRPNRPMGNPHKGPGRASQLEAGVSYPAKRARSSDNDPLRGRSSGNKIVMQNQMEQFLHAVTSKHIKEEDAIEKRPGTYCVSRGRSSLIPWYRLTSVQNIQASLREFITTIQANSVMMDKNELDELLRMTSLLKTGPSAMEPRQEERRASTVSILPPIKKGRKVSSRRRGSEEGRSREEGRSSGGEVSRKRSLLSPLNVTPRPSRSFTYCSMPTVVF